MIYSTVFYYIPPSNDDVNFLFFDNHLCDFRAIQNDHFVRSSSHLITIIAARFLLYDPISRFVQSHLRLLKFFFFASYVNICFNPISIWHTITFVLPISNLNYDFFLLPWSNRCIWTCSHSYIWFMYPSSACWCTQWPFITSLMIWFDVEGRNG